MSVIPWSALRNPILRDPDRLLKDPCALSHDGRFYLFTHRVYVSPDLLHWEEIRQLRPLRSQPDVTWYNGQWYLATNGPPLPDAAPGLAAPRYHVWPTLEHWLEGEPLFPGWAGQRVIDPALAFEGGYCFAMVKVRQRPYVARLRIQGTRLDSLDRPGLRASLRGGGWLGSLLGEHWGEQFQLAQIDGWWHLLTTGRRYDPWSLAQLALHPYTGNHHPFLYRQREAGHRLEDWQVWVGRRELVIPRESWNRAMHANGAYLCDWRHLDGHWYLFYAGSPDHTAFERRGHDAIGVARSRDLVTWRVAGDAR